MSARARVHRSQLVPWVLAHVHAKGVDAGALAARCGLPTSALGDAEVVLPLATERAFLEAAEKELRDPLLGAHVALTRPRGSYRIVEYIVRSSPTVREAIHRIVRYVSLLTDAVEITFTEENGAGVLEHRFPGEALGVGRHGNEFFIVMCIASGAELTGGPFVPRRVWFAHPAPVDASALARVLGHAKLEFGRDANGFELDSALLDRKIASFDAPLLSLLDEQATKTLEEHAPGRTFADQVRQAVRAALTGATPQLEAVAQILAVSPRTLQRRLRDEDVTFQQIVESAREEAARAHVIAGRMALGEIAYRLGYAELSAFFRAFKRWTGMTPTQYREAKRGG